MEQHDIPKWIHVFVCVNDRNGERVSCADGDAVAVRQRLKAVAKERGWWNKTVRVSQTGCLGLCQGGPNVLIHPAGAHFSHVTSDDVDTLVDAIEDSLS